MGREWRSRFCTGLAAQDGTRNGSVTPQFDRGLGGDAHDSPEYGQQAVDLGKLDLALGILGLHQPFQQCGCCRVVHDVKLAAVDDAVLMQKLESDERAMNEVANATLLRVQKAVGLR